MAFFHNRAVNLFNLHFAIHSVAFLGGGAFYAVYLLQSGLSVPAVLIAMGSAQAIRFFIRPAVIVFAARFGLRQTLITGTLLMACQYPLLAEVSGLGAALYALIAVTAVSDVFYWTSYHTTFARLGDDEHRGSQIGVQQASMALVGIFSPLLSGWLLVTFGPRVAFDTSGVIVVLSTLPMLWTPNLKVARRLPGAFRDALQVTLVLQGADGFMAAGIVFVWQIALFLSLGSSYLNYGGALALAAVVGAAGSLVLGRFVDLGHGVRMVWLSVGVFAAAVVVRALAVGDPVLAVAANALSPLAAALYTPVNMTPVYVRAKRSACPLRFHVAMEGAWDAGNVTACLLSAGLIAAGLSLQWAILLSLVGLALCFVLLRRYFLAYPAAALAPMEA